MKKVFQFLPLIIACTMLSSFKPLKSNTSTIEYRYYVVQGWEVSTATGKRETQPLVTNVVYVDCKYHSASRTEIGLQDFYKAYYMKARKADWIDNLLAWKFDTRDKAEQKRREIVAKYNNDENYELLFINNFRVLCDD